MAHAPRARSKPREDEAAQTLRTPSSQFCIQRVGSGWQSKAFPGNALHFPLHGPRQKGFEGHSECCWDLVEAIPSAWLSRTAAHKGSPGIYPEGPAQTWDHPGPLEPAA